MAAKKEPTANGTITFRGNQHEEFSRCADLYGNWLTEITFHKCSILFIPDCIGNCFLLEKMSFYRCMEFTHFIPSLGRLSRLHSLFVDAWRYCALEPYTFWICTPSCWFHKMVVHGPRYCFAE
jgi:hypothetical protein